MASIKKIGFFWGEKKLTLVEFNKNAPLQVFTASPTSTKTENSPFSASFNDEIQATANIQKMIQDSQFYPSCFYISLPLKDIILRSFIIPFVKNEDLQNAIKFEAKKYMPIDIQELNFVHMAVPFTENKVNRLRIILFAVRRECLERYERIFKQANAVISQCEPCVVSLTKVLLFKKEINLTDHVAFLTLEENSGSICFIHKGIPQFIREFSISPLSAIEGVAAGTDILNLRIVNEVVNSFDFYARQFSEDEIQYMLVSAESLGPELLNALETELKIKLRKISPLVTMGEVGHCGDIEAFYAMGACVSSVSDSLSTFNFIEDKSSKSPMDIDLNVLIRKNKDIVIELLVCSLILLGIFLLLQSGSSTIQRQYNQVSAQLGSSINLPVESIQSDMQQTVNKLADYKKIRTESHVVTILLKVASHLPKGAVLNDLEIEYNMDDQTDQKMTIVMKGDVVGDDANGQLATVNKIYSSLKDDPELSKYIQAVNLVSLNREEFAGRQATGFSIRCT